MTSTNGDPQSVDADPTQVIAHLASQIGELTRQVAVLSSAYQAKTAESDQLRAMLAERNGHPEHAAERVTSGGAAAAQVATD